MKEVETPSPPKSKPQSQNLSKELPDKDSDPVVNAKNSQENGVRVSDNGNEGSGDLDDTQPLVDKNLDVQDTVVDMVCNEEGLEDYEINGVSSLLQMQESKSLHELGSVLDVIGQNENLGSHSPGVNSTDVKERKQVGWNLRSASSAGNDGYSDGKIGTLDDSKDRDVEDDSGDEKHDFDVGDFVWGKIRSHPWWPGRIYDPSDASDFAKKVKQRDKILVAYFGDGTFAWCNPSQLKPLDENFVEMSRQSNSRNFLNAVEDAMDEVGRLVDLKVTCSCVPKEYLIGFGRILASNAGIKEGLLIPAGGIDKLSSALFESAEFLASLKDSAQAGGVTNILELTILKSWLSAFYRANGGHKLPSYHDPSPIGHEDESRSWVVDLSTYGRGVDARIKCPVEEDGLTSTRRIDQTTESVLQKCQGVLEDGTYQSRKQKSLAEILEVQTDAEVGKKDDVSGEGTVSNKRKMKKSMGENTSADGEVTDATEGSSVVKPAPSSGRKKRKASDEADTEGKNKKQDAATAGENLGKPNPSSGLKKRKGTKEADDSNDLLSKLGARKEKKLSKSLADENSKVTNPAADARAVKKESVKTPLPRGMKKKGSSSDGTGGKNEEMGKKTLSAKRGRPTSNNDNKAKELIEQSSSPRERKRSKYLSPPYTNLNKGQRIEKESQKVSSEARVAESLVKASENLIWSSPILKSSGKKVQKKSDEEPGLAHVTSDSSGPQTPKPGHNNTIDPKTVKGPPKVVLSKMRSAAVNPLFLKETNSLDMVGKFFSAFRNSSYINVPASDYNELHSGRKRKSQKDELGSLVKEQNQSGQSLPERKSKKVEEAKVDKPKVKQASSASDKKDKPKVKQASSASDKKKKDREPSREAPGAALFVTFGPLSSLPTKNDLIDIYGKYGALNKDETEMLYTNFCARVVFLKTSEAEEAFNESQLSNPFKSANVKFRLHYLSAETKTRELRDIPGNKHSKSKEGAKKTPGMPSVSQSSESNEAQLNFIKQKLEMITSLLETSAGKISPDMKSTLESEIKVLVEKVSSMVGSSS